jgi:hypothetical protein
VHDDKVGATASGGRRASPGHQETGSAFPSS